MRWFLYGSLRDPAVLAGWRRVARAGGPWPTLRRDRTGRVRGALLAVPAVARARLGAYEGAAYRLRRVIVVTSRGLRAALAWIAADAARRPWKEP